MIGVIPASYLTNVKLDVYQTGSAFLGSLIGNIGGLKKSRFPKLVVRVNQQWNLREKGAMLPLNPSEIDRN